MNCMYHKCETYVQLHIYMYVYPGIKTQIIVCIANVIFKKKKEVDDFLYFLLKLLNVIIYLF